MSPKEVDFEFTRGDTCPIIFTLVDSNGEILNITDGTEIYFTLKKTDRKSDSILQKKYTSGDITLDEDTKELSFVLTHEDTAELKYGTYAYDIQVKSETYVKTICKGSIELTSEVTWLVNE